MQHRQVFFIVLGYDDVTRPEAPGGIIKWSRYLDLKKAVKKFDRLTNVGFDSFFYAVKVRFFKGFIPGTTEEIQLFDADIQMLRGKPDFKILRAIGQITQDAIDELLHRSVR